MPKNLRDVSFRGLMSFERKMVMTKLLLMVKHSSGHFQENAQRLYIVLPHGVKPTDSYWHS